MVEINIKLTGETLHNKNVDKLLQLVRDIGSEETVAPPKNIQTIGYEIAQKEIAPVEQGNTDELKVETKELFTLLAREDKPKAKEILNHYKVSKFSDLDTVLKTVNDWAGFRDKLKNK